MNHVDLCASSVHNYTKFIEVFKNILTMMKFPHVIRHVFGGWVVVENKTKHYGFFITDDP